MNYIEQIALDTIENGFREANKNAGHVDEVIRVGDVVVSMTEETDLTHERFVTIYNFDSGKTIEEFDYSNPEQSAAVVFDELKKLNDEMK